jgi:hypothetical protein
MRTIDVLLSGLFGQSNRGFLGWSAIYLVTTPSGQGFLDRTCHGGNKCRIADPNINFRVAAFWESAPLLWQR